MDFDIILVNDGSTDGSAQICQDYARDFEQIRVIHQENQGPAVARNVGFAHSTGRHVTFVDSDDWLDPAFLETLWDICQTEEAKIAAISYFYFQEDGGKFLFPISKMAKETQVYDLVDWLTFDGDGRYRHTIFTAVWGKLYSRELFERVKFPRGKLSEDEFVCYKLYLRAENVAFSDKQLYSYRQRKGSITKSDDFQRLSKQTLQVLEEKITLLSALGIPHPQQLLLYKDGLDYICQKALAQGDVDLYEELILKLELLKQYNP